MVRGDVLLEVRAGPVAGINRAIAGQRARCPRRVWACGGDGGNPPAAGSPSTHAIEQAAGLIRRYPLRLCLR